MVAVGGLGGVAGGQERLPTALAGSWRIDRILPTSGVACWGDKEAKPLLGSLLIYRQDAMRWKGGEVPLLGVTTRTVGAKDLTGEDGAMPSGGAPTFAQLHIRAAKVTEVDLQHDDADITGATTEVPGDTVLLAGPRRIVVSACGVYFEARRVAGQEPAPAGGSSQ